MVGYSLSTVAAITAMSGSIEAFTPGNNSGWARSITSTTTTERSSSLAFSSILYAALVHRVMVIHVHVVLVRG